VKSLNFEEVHEYIATAILDIEQHQVEMLQNLTFEDLLDLNPYFLAFFRIREPISAGSLLQGLLQAFLSSSEEKLFGDFLENLAVFIAGKTCGGHKSTAPGVDLEFIHNGIHYVVSIKSGPNWGNSSQQNRLEQDLKNAVMRVKQSKFGTNVQPVLGICYGKTKTGFLRGYLKVVGQNFWYLISENKDLYTDIIKPISCRATEYNEQFYEEKSGLLNRFTKQFIERFCDNTGDIDWSKLVEFNSGNYDLDQFLSDKI
jgi:hypothetical protein